MYPYWLSSYSIPMTVRPSRWPTNNVVPKPAKGSRILPPLFVNLRMNISTNSSVYRISVSPLNLIFFSLLEIKNQDFSICDSFMFTNKNMSDGEHNTLDVCQSEYVFTPSEARRVKKMQGAGFSVQAFFIEKISTLKAGPRICQTPAADGNILGAHPASGIRTFEPAQALSHGVSYGTSQYWRLFPRGFCHMKGRSQKGRPKRRTFDRALSSLHEC
jgi:hypothetical protein